ncbi:MAG: transposase [Rikenellaceae bacterium]|nr:transposase [Rikenellaceae bacterium]
MFKRECVPAIAGKTIFADKIYRDNPYWNNERYIKNNELLTPIKAIKGGATEEEKQRNKAADELYSAAVSSAREPVEAFYSWLINKTTIQRAQKCRSTAKLLMHTLGKLAIAFIF